MLKLFALAVATIYVAVAFFVWGTALGFVTLAVLLVPVAAIWFGRSLGERLRLGLFSAGVDAPSAVEETPRSFVEFAGWVLLLLVVIFGLVYLRFFGWVLLLFLAAIGFVFLVRRRREGD